MASSTHDYEDASHNSDILSLSLKKENISSYGGIFSNLSEEHSITDFSDNNSSKKKDNNTDTQNITFQWDENEPDSKVVYLTGSFCNWKQFFIMPKVDNKYSITLALPKALHKFKFRINEIYKLNNNYPVMKDGEINCNYIDTSNTKDTTESKTIISSKMKENENSNNEMKSDEEEESKSSFSSDDSSYYEAELEDEQERIKRIRKRKMKKKKYSQRHPNKDDLNNYPPDIPYTYNYMYNINVISSQNLIGKRKYYEPKENNVLGDNCYYKKIGVLPAFEINHIHSNNLIVSGNRALCSSFVRYRNKFITLLYYKPF